MGRTKLQLKLIPDGKRLRATYRKRISGLKKKASELSTLCDIGVALVSFGPDGQVHTWPENNHELLGIVKKFIGLNKEKQRKPQVTLSDYLHGQVSKLEGHLARVQGSTSESTAKSSTHQSPASIACDTSHVELLTITEACSFSQDAFWQSMDYFGNQILDPTSAPPFVSTGDKQAANSSSCNTPVGLDPTVGFNGFGDALLDSAFNTTLPSPSPVDYLMETGCMDCEALPSPASQPLESKFCGAWGEHFSRWAAIAGTQNRC